MPKISELPAAAALTGAEAVPLVQSGANVQAPLSAVLPAGTVQMYGGPTAPTGWLLCHGQAVSRAAFPALFAALGTAWGAGDGTSTFNVPDMRGRTAIGAGTGAGLTARTLGATGGSEKTDTTGLRVNGTTGPADAASPGGGKVLANAAISFGGDVGDIRIYGPAAPANGGTAQSVGGVAGDGTASAATGAGNMPPFASLNFIVKT